VLDGAMGTMIQRYQLREEDFRGYRFAKHPQTLTGCNDLLSMTCPVVVRDIHRRYLEAGADLIETNTFNAQRISLADYGLEDHVRDINLAACELAREAADDFTTEEKPRYVLGSIGPTSKTTSMSTGKEPALDKNTLKAAYREQIDALIDGGVDALLIETIFDVENARQAIEAAQEAMQQKGKELPIMLSFSVSTPDGHNMLGQSIFDFLDSLSCDPFSVGINCYADVSEMLPLLQQLGARYPYRISAYPNAGMPDGKGQYNKTPEQHQQDLWPLLDGHIVDILGGCCGTTDQFIAKIAELVQPAKGCYISPRRETYRPTPALPMREGANTIATENVTTPKTNNSLPHREGRGGSGGSGGSVVSLSVFSSILSGNAADCATATKAAITSGASPQDIINGEMIRAMSEVGQRFQDGKAFVPQLLMAGRAMKAGLEELKPLMAGQDATSIGKVVIGTVKGDLHDIGKNLVASMLEGCGFEVINIGIDVSADKFIEEVKKNQPDILCMSALLTTTMGYMKEVIDALEKAGIRDRVKVMVGGAPVSQGFADEIGADGYSDNANTAVQVAKQLLGK
jgi:corrinoid protein of di/trimethylamine methyltransferase